MVLQNLGIKYFFVNIGTGYKKEVIPVLVTFEAIGIPDSLMGLCRAPKDASGWIRDF